MLAEPTTMVLLYTAALGGKLDLLPRLMTRIRPERTPYTLLVDLGRSCQPGWWICDATDGRGMLVAMDAMGYDAFHIGPADPLYTQPGTVMQLREVIQTPVAAGPWTGLSRRKGIVFGFSARPDARPTEAVDLLVTLQLGRYPRADLEFDGETRLLHFDAGWTSDEPLLGKLDIELVPEAPYARIIAQSQLSLPETLFPDPSITGVVEFVESEARSAQRKRGSLD